MKPLFKSKTVIINGVVAVLAVVALFVEMGPGLGIPETTLKWIGFVYAAVNVILRMVTTQGVALKPVEGGAAKGPEGQ